MNDAVIVGNGVVGQVTAKVFGIKDYFDLKGSTLTLQEAAKRKFIFICLPTPTKNGEYDTSAIRETVRQLNEYGCGGVVVNRSTVPPGTDLQLQREYNVPVVANPEFLSEKTAEYDAKHPDFILIGADISDYAKAVRGLYEARFKGIDIIETDTITAETAKLAMNSLYATKVVFANEVYDYCQKAGANYETVKETLYHSKYVGKNHLGVFHKGGRGAGGRCLKKDLEGFTQITKSPLLEVVSRINSELLAEYPKNG